VAGLVRIGPGLSLKCDPFPHLPSAPQGLPRSASPRVYTLHPGA
jgi:hypothetical protein